ncbi:DedA family protein [Weissella tructae]|uniref:SNARE-like domain protein n=2 Tax=Weissella TaxID=46255 RepID=A0A075TU42_9LACO|nr:MULTISPECIES: DedA family protein [Weissella]AIG65039.1 SNARE-like domain protein [Weissella tructae]AIM62351.1 SNARE-like domain protein [Weissella ceti]AIM63690.1 SNARE-like domain protein [Weissella ceti]ELA07768.1 hypothetical protein WCNC_00767 [Weissella ceti NC36]QVV91444.1 DedA family protein [Weissella tructae]
MEQFIETAISQYGYLAIALLITLENVFPPIPSELILTFAGFVTYSTDLSIVGAVLAATVGAVLGATILYWIGTYLDMERLEQLVNSRLGRILRLRLADFQKAEEHFMKHGRAAVFFGRFVPIVRSMISVPAGMTGMPFGRFLMYTTLGTLIWNTVLVSLGHFAGRAWTQVLAAVDNVTSIMTVVLIIVFIIGGIIYLVRRNKESAS